MTLHGAHSPAPSDPLPREWLLRPLVRVVRFCDKAGWFWARAPRWATRWRKAYGAWFLSQTLVVRMERGFARGIGLFAAQFPAGTDAATVVAWFEQQITASRPIHIPPLDTVYCYVYHSPTDAGSPITDMVGVWQGTASRWWSEGADAVESLVPSAHQGLHILIFHVSDLVAAASQSAPWV